MVSHSVDGYGVFKLVVVVRVAAMSFSLLYSIAIVVVEVVVVVVWWRSLLLWSLSRPSWRS